MRDPLLLLFGVLLISTMSLHGFVRLKLRWVRNSVQEAALADAADLAGLDSAGLGPFRAALGRAGQGAGAAASKRLNQTRELIAQGLKAESELANETQAFLLWLRNHELISHNVSRPVARPPPPVRVCIPISITTRGTHWKSVSEMLLLSSFLPSLVRTTEPGFSFGVYLGYDAGDPLLDSVSGQVEILRLARPIIGEADIELRSFRYTDSKNRNVWAVNYITRECYLEGYDYFYRVNDDSAFEGAWAGSLTKRMRESKDFGVVGVYDKHNPRIFTHSMVGRPHLEVFGYYFPFEFGNYWSDDWITAVYQAPFVYKAYDISVKHHLHAERYKVEYERKQLLEEMVNLGRKRWKAYLCLVRKVPEYCDGQETAFRGVWSA